MLAFSDKPAIGSISRSGAHGIAKKPALPVATQYGILLYGHGWRKPTTKAPAIRWHSESGSRSADPVRNGRGRLSKLPRSLGGRALTRAARRARSSRQRAALNVVAQAALIAESVLAAMVRGVISRASSRDFDQTFRFSARVAGFAGLPAAQVLQAVFRDRVRGASRALGPPAASGLRFFFHARVFHLSSFAPLPYYRWPAEKRKGAK